MKDPNLHLPANFRVIESHAWLGSGDKSWAFVLAKLADAPHLEPFALLVNEDDAR